MSCFVSKQIISQQQEITVHMMHHRASNSPLKSDCVQAMLPLSTHISPNVSNISGTKAACVLVSTWWMSLCTMEDGAHSFCWMCPLHELPTESLKAELIPSFILRLEGISPQFALRDAALPPDNRGSEDHGATLCFIL